MRLTAAYQAAQPSLPGTADGVPLDIARRLFLIGMAMASFDIFLTLNIGGFTLRAHQVLLAIPTAYATGLIFSDKNVRVPLGGFFLFIWTIFVFAFVPNTPYVTRSIGYAGWLFLDITVLMVAVQLFDDIQSITLLLKWYVASFLVVSSFGLLQLALGVLHLPAPYVRQWIIPGWWPRVNGFSYEPSYFATYLLMGWVLCAWLIEKRSTLLPAKLVRGTFIVATVALVFCTSRLGWAAVLLWSAVYGMRRMRSFQAPTLSLVSWFITINLLILPFAGVAAYSFYKPDKLMRMLTFGTGLFGTPAHSVDVRQNAFLDTLSLVRKSPLVGYSLGGIAPAIAKERHMIVESNERAKSSEGLSIFAEALAATGIIGFIPFLAFIASLFIKPIKLAQTCEEQFRIPLIGLVWALAMEFLVLQFSQNILRPYLWFHIAVLSAVFVAVSEEARRKPIAAPYRVTGPQPCAT